MSTKRHRIKSLNERTIPPVRPSLGVEAEYKRRLVNLIEAMHDSVLYWLKAAYRKNEPEQAQDELPATTLRKALKELQLQWFHRFDDAASELAKYFAKSADKRSTHALQSLLRKQGYSVKFKMTRGAADVLHATINANVNLIKSIPQKYLNDVEGAVMRSVQTGRDLHQLTEELEHTFKVTRRRAELIARDQNNKATAAMTRGRQAELGITEAIWVHSGGGRHPRPTHVKAGRDRVRYNIKQGWYDPAIKKFIWPGTEIGCHCVSRSVVPGFA